MSVQSFIDQGRAYHSKGILPLALQNYQTAYRSLPQDPELNSLIGQVLISQGEGESSLHFFKEAVKFAPAHFGHRFNLGQALISINKYENALPYCQEAVQLNNKSSLAWSNQGQCQYELKEYTEAVKSLKKAVKIDEGNHSAWTALGLCYIEKNNFNEAKRCLFKADQIKPSFASKFNLYKVADKLNDNSGRLLWFRKAMSTAALDQNKLETLLKAFESTKKESKLQSEEILNEDIASELFSRLSESYYQNKAIEKALEYAKSAYDANPDNIFNVIRMAIYLVDTGDYEQAETYYKNAFEMLPKTPEAEPFLRHKYSILKKDLGDFIAAQAELEKAKALAPTDAQINYALAVVSSLIGENNTAIKLLEENLDHNPRHAESLFELALFQLATGKFDEGWRNYGVRSVLDQKQPFFPHPISGQPLKRPDLGDIKNYIGKSVLILKEQGLGDELFFLRYAKDIKEAGVSLSLLTDSRLVPMLSRTELFDQVYTPDEFNNFEADRYNDYFVEGDLPLLIEGNHTPPPIVLSALTNKSNLVQQELSRYPTKPIVGITWEAGVKRTAGIASTLHKRIDIECVIDLFKNVDCNIVVMQRNPTEDDLLKLNSIFEERIIDLKHLNDDLEAMLALCEQLDYYLGVSNTNMHIHASVGGKASVLVPHPSEWRWMLEGNTSPWFPGFKIYRQDSSFGWNEALKTLEKQLPTEIQQ